MLSDAEPEDPSIGQLTVNEHYAKAFQYRKDREELEKLKLKYGSDAEEDDLEDSEDSESDESEDEDGEELTPAVDAAILRTLARIKRKDPEIYNVEKGIFQEERQKLGSDKQVMRPAKEKPSKPITMRQAALESALNPASRTPSPEPLTHVEKQRALRDETVAAFRNAASEDDEDDFLVPREKTKDEQEQEEEEYKAFLQREVGKNLQDLVTVEDNAIFASDEEVISSPSSKEKKNKKNKKKKKDISSTGRSKEEENQEFLMNFILNRGWIDRSTRHIPTYNEITSSKKDKGKQKAEDNEEENEEDILGADSEALEDFDDIADTFEASYNFRFEEPDAATIKSFPRVLPSTVRREDTTRKDARTRKKERKEQEMAQKREEVKRLKALKVKDMRSKLEKIGREGGMKFKDDPALQDLDLDAEWDPVVHDQKMEALYGENGEFDDSEKPTWNDDIDVGGIANDDIDVSSSKKSKKKKKKKSAADDVGVDVDAMDADVQPLYDANADEEEWDGTEEMRKRKLDEYIQQLYELDFNDIVAGIPTRFHYTNVQPQNFALTPSEILMATDTELNEFMSIKKLAPYRKSQWDNQRTDKLKELKTKIAERSGHRLEVEERPAKKRMGKKERQKKKESAEGPEVKQPVVGEKRKRSGEENGSNMTEEREQDVPSNPTGKKKKRRHRKKDDAEIVA